MSKYGRRCTLCRICTRLLVGIFGYCQTNRRQNRRIIEACCMFNSLNQTVIVTRSTAPYPLNGVQVALEYAPIPEIRM